MNIDELIFHLYDTASRLEEARMALKTIRKEPRDEYALRDLLKAVTQLNKADTAMEDAIDLLKKAK